MKRPDTEVRARPGYLAPTEAEARAAGGSMTSAPGANAPPPTVTRARLRFGRRQVARPRTHFGVGPLHFHADAPKAPSPQ